ncbi:hypothetical protein FHS55_002640 [Angulomicrobium tetraedrale]|uniref:Uncharacterized protein n=1 Tax=Ancylobacter tetraedralis TaxID=217068 RepID=A0A839ZBD2_9HYPH|nr:hypothetical protein [Ancylobacter tetraedralis]MBB3772031.1 hypothetical protein [Ancylobacter tetraedralis]
MAQTTAQKLVQLGVPTEVAKTVAAAIASDSLQIGTSSTTAMAGNRTPTTTIRGGVLQQTATADIGGSPSQADFNALLAKLRSAGLLASS